MEQITQLQFMESALESSVNAIVLADLKGRLFYVNPMFLRLWRYRDQSEIMGRKTSDFWINEGNEVNFLTILQEQGSCVLNQTAVRRDGSSFRVLVSANYVLDEQGNPTCLMFSLIDRGESDPVQQRHRPLYELCLDLSVSVDPGSLFRAIRKRLGAFMDTRHFFVALRDEDSGGISFPFFEGADRPRDGEAGIRVLEGLIDELMRVGTPRLFHGSEIEAYLRPRENGVYEGVPKVWVGVPVGIKDAVFGVLGVMSYDNQDHYTEKDIPVLQSVSTLFALALDRNRSRDALKESRGKYRDILESVQDGYYEMDLDGTFTFFNHALIRILNHETDDLRGMHINKFADKENAELCSQIYGRIKATGAPVNNFEWTLTRPDGEERQVTASASLLRDTRGQVIGFQGMIRDVTDQKRLEAALQQTQKMEAIGTLAGGIAHNFNNLLMGIQGNISLMLLDVNEESPLHPRLINMERLVQTGSKLTSQLLGYAREGRYQLAPLSINQLVMETAETYSMTKKEIRMHWDLMDDLHEIMADRSQFEQILLNLFINASDAMPKGGDLFLSTCNATHKDMIARNYKPMQGDYVRLVVKDTGIGMDRKTMDRIFDPFFTTKGPSKGTGLGLASVYGIVKSHGGYIDVFSTEGEGTAFHIFFPAAKRRAARDATRSLDEGLHTILLVDDEQIILEIGEEMLRKLGYDVLVAGGGREAIETYLDARDGVDLVILDMIMPDMSGGDVYDRLKDINPDVKVLLSSGYSIDGQASEIIERGCDGFIQKPFNLRDLSSKIRDIVTK